MSIWVVVADSSKARILMAEKPGVGLAEIDALEHPEGHFHERELTSDLPGRVFDRRGEGRHAVGSGVDPKQHEQSSLLNGWWIILRRAVQQEAMQSYI